MPSDFATHCFNIKFATKGTKFVACGSNEDRSQWFRVLSLIAQMNSLKVDSKSVNLFKFEQHPISQFNAN